MCSVYRVLNPLPSIVLFVSLLFVACGLPGVTPKPPPNNTATGRSTQSHAHSHSQCDRTTKCGVFTVYWGLKMWKVRPWNHLTLCFYNMYRLQHHSGRMAGVGREPLLHKRQHNVCRRCSALLSAETRWLGLYQQQSRKYLPMETGAHFHSYIRMVHILKDYLWISK